MFAFRSINPEPDGEQTLVFSVFISVIKELIVFFYAFIVQEKRKSEKNFEIKVKKRSKAFEILKGFIISNYSTFIIIALGIENSLTRDFGREILHIEYSDGPGFVNQIFLVFIVCLAAYYCSVFIELKLRYSLIKKPIARFFFYVSLLLVPVTVTYNSISF